ncbi:MAG: ATP-binding cassette domain-containing protein [Peptococcaceae bacterium]|nr:ATP-binding cassette domain-containing protein [Peptococcaceae bacterium]
METILKMKNLCCKSGRRYLLNDICWEVKAGEHWLIFGMNGSGKTTLSSTIAGYKPITSGNLHVLGESYRRENIFSLRKKVGWVSSSFFDKCYTEEPALHIVLSALTGTLNVDDTIQDKDVRFAKALLRELHMDEKMHQPFHLMSKGERQNVLIARALITRPSLLILDEPGAGLDIYAREHMMQTVHDLAEHGHVTILYITHYPEEIQPFMNKTMLLRNGRIFAQGDTDLMLTSEKISALINEPVCVQKTQNGLIQMQVQASTSLCELCYGRERII